MFMVLMSVLCFSSEDGKQKITIAYESECPGCTQLLSGTIQQALNKEGFLDMVDLTLLPYGNAHTQGGTVTCQHGPAEC